VIEVCGLDEENPLLSEGLATRVEERGRNLPEGLRARIALARAMMPAPRLLLVDDLTFSTDPAAARALARLRRSMRLTIIVAGVESDDTREYDWVWRLDSCESADAQEIAPDGSPPEALRNPDLIRGEGFPHVGMLQESLA